jgi:hypothetical protein
MTVNTKVPVLEGVPPIVPVAGSNVRPGGSAPDTHDQQ